ncbi:hypothetical protein D3C81_348240 [compost metagenome]
MATNLHQAAADEGQIGGRQHQRQLAHGVAQVDFVALADRTARRAQHAAVRGAQLGHPGKALGMARHQDQQGRWVRPEHPIEGGQHLLVFPLMGAGGDPDRPLLSKLLAQGAASGLHLIAKLDVELDGAGHRQPLAAYAQTMEAIRVVLVLAQQMGQRTAEGIEGALETGIALAGSLGEAGIEDGHRQVACLAGRQPVRPQLCLHHPEGAGLEGGQKCRDGPGVVQGRIAMHHQIPELGRLLGAGAGGGGEQYGQGGLLRLEGADEGADGQRLPHAHRMDPERRLLPCGRRPPQVLGPALAEAGLAFFGLVERQQRQRQAQVDQQVVEQPIDHATGLRRRSRAPPPAAARSPDPPTRSAPVACPPLSPAPASTRSGT